MRNLIAAIMGCLAFAGATQDALAQAPRASSTAITPAGPLIPQIMGRWDIAFRSPQANLDTVWIVEPSAQGSTSLGTVGNNPVGLAVTTAQLSGDMLTLTGNTTLGPLSITGRLDGDRIAGRFTTGSVAGDFVATRRPDVRSSALVDIFDQATATFERSLFTAAPFDDAWRARRDALRTELLASGTTERDMVRAVRTLVAAARMSHNNFYIPSSSEAQVEAARTVPAVTWRRLEGNLGYIRIESFVENPLERERVDAAFSELADTRGLVIDLRGNGGGNLGLAIRLGDHLFPANTASGLFATRKGLDAAGVASMDRLPASAYRSFDGYAVDEFQAVLAETGAVSLVTGGRAPAYTAPVALLIDGNSGSASEAMAAVMKETRRARRFGSTTAGAMLASRMFPMPDGYVLRLAFADFRTPGGAVAEEVGVVPDQQVRGNEEAVLQAATRWLTRTRPTSR
ncbi:S41 family peptidase [uncultured Brevundimonas sp.]|uniref:S41 family peptidase n=1 Tax=uncultured Brevundimonas sp. TaxID=213418 RepID=UPI0025FB153A|nr:S41 family peptidase [uncultured Brevundimonas sp.]